MMPDYDPDGLSAESVVTMDRDLVVLCVTVMRCTPATAELKASVDGRIVEVSSPQAETPGTRERGRPAGSGHPGDPGLYRLSSRRDRQTPAPGFSARR